MYYKTTLLGDETFVWKSSSADVHKSTACCAMDVQVSSTLVL